MAIATRYAEGNYVDYTPSGADVDAGDVIDLGDLVGIAERDIPDGVQGALAIEGAFTVAKKTGETWTLGQKLVWDQGTESFSNNASYSEAVAGLAAADAASGDATGILKLTPGVARS